MKWEICERMMTVAVRFCAFPRAFSHEGLRLLRNCWPSSFSYPASPIIINIVVIIMINNNNNNDDDNNAVNIVNDTTIAIDINNSNNLSRKPL